MKAVNISGISFNFYVKELFKTIKFYDLLFGSTETYSGSLKAKYQIERSFFTLLFIEDHNLIQQKSGFFSLQVESEKELVQLSKELKALGYLITESLEKEELSTIGFHVNDPDGITWKIYCQQGTRNFLGFKLPRMVTTWELLK